jgi:hypothetical protein
MKEIRSSTVHIMPATLSQFETLDKSSKSVYMVSYRWLCSGNNGVPSAYTQSLMGQGRQHSTVPCRVGVGAQNRPGTSTDD